MGLFKNQNQKIFERVIKESGVQPQRKMVECPNCGTRMTVTFLGSNDSTSCQKCGYKIYND